MFELYFTNRCYWYDYLCLAMYYIVPMDRSVWEVMAIIVLESLIFSDNFLIHEPSLSEHERESACSDSI